MRKTILLYGTKKVKKLLFHPNETLTNMEFQTNNVYHLCPAEWREWKGDLAAVRRKQYSVYCTFLKYRCRIQ